MANDFRSGSHLHPLRQQLSSPGGGGTKLQQQLRFLGVFFLTFVGAYAGYVALMYASMPIQKKLLQNMFEGAEGMMGPRDPAPHSAAPVPVSIQIDRQCVPNYAGRRINQNSFSSNTMSISSNGSLYNRQSEFAWPTNGYGPGAEVLPNEAVRYFNCVMTIQQDRFCTAEERRRLASQLISIDRQRAVWLTALNSMRTTTSIDFGNHSSRPRVSVGTLRSEIDGLFELIGPNLRYLAQVGYIDAKDFGYFTRIPESIGRYIVPKTQDRCRK